MVGATRTRYISHTQSERLASLPSTIYLLKVRLPLKRTASLEAGRLADTCICILFICQYLTSSLKLN